MDTRTQINNIKKRLNVKTDSQLATIFGVSSAAISFWVKRKKIPDNVWYKLKELNYDVENVPPPPEISPHAVADCEKISGELETVKGMVEFYRGELEQVRGELNRTKDELIFALKEIARLTRELNTGVDARQQSGRSVVERGNTANALEIQKVMA